MSKNISHSIRSVGGRPMGWWHPGQIKSLAALAQLSLPFAMAHPALSRETLRGQQGSAIVETPFVLAVLFFLLAFPLLDLATIGMRSLFLIAAARDAAHFAGRTNSYALAVESARAKAEMTASLIPGVTLKRVRVAVIETPHGSRPHRHLGPLPRNRLRNMAHAVYSVEVTTTGEVQPFFLLPKGGLIPDAPGLTGPISLSISAREFCEHPMGFVE